MEKITRNTKWLLYSDDIEDMMGTEEERRKQYSECNEVPLEDIEDDALESWCRGCLDAYWDDFQEFTHKTQQCLCIANLGLWHGRRDGGMTGTFENLLYHALEDYSNSIYYFPKDGHMEIEAIHHDGTNYFKIYGLSEEGKRYVRNHECDEPRMVHNHLLRNKGKYLCPVVYTNI